MIDQMLKFFAKKKWALPALIAVCVVSIGLMIWGIIANPLGKPQFEKPPFEKAVAVGDPNANDALKKYGYQLFHQDAMDFSTGLCGVVDLKDGAADLYFYNHQDNQVWMKLRITDTSGKTIAETGLIKPGEYLKTVQFDKSPKPGSDIHIKVMSYEPETYYSAGSFGISTKIAG